MMFHKELRARGMCANHTKKRIDDDNEDEKAQFGSKFRVMIGSSKMNHTVSY